MRQPRGKVATLAAILRHFEKMGRQGPLLVIVEDIHWADPTTLDLMDLLVEKVATAADAAGHYQPARNTTAMARLVRRSRFKR